jgi:hypothetical protein
VGRQGEEAIRIVHNFVDPIVKAALKKKKRSKESPLKGTENVTLLEDLVNQTDGMHLVFF